MSHESPLKKPVKKITKPTTPLKEKSLFSSLTKVVDWALKSPIGKEAVKIAESIYGSAAALFITSFGLVKSFTPVFILTRAENTWALAHKAYAAPHQTLEEVVPSAVPYVDYGVKVATSTQEAVSTRVSGAITTVSSAKDFANAQVTSAKEFTNAKVLTATEFANAQVLTAKDYASTTVQKGIEIVSHPKDSLAKLPSPLAAPALWAFSTTESIAGLAYRVVFKKSA